MRRSLLVIGVLLILAGFYVLNEGVQILVPIAELTGLTSQVQTESPIVPPTLLSVPPGNYTFLPVNLQAGVTAKGALQVGNGQAIALYVMDDQNFVLWKKGQPSTIILARPTAISYNFTLPSQAAGTYYFVFDNQDTTKKVVIFSLSVQESSTVLNPVVNYAGYELFVLGLLLFVIGARTGRSKPKYEEAKVADTGVRCRFCGARLATNETFCSKCGRAQQ